MSPSGAGGGTTEQFFTITLNNGPISQLGQRQALSGAIVTNAADRQAIASILKMLSQSPSAQAALRQSISKR
jgi:hypothetical protein